MNTFTVAPCYFYQIDEEQDKEYTELLWRELTEAADEGMPVVAGTKDNVML